MRKSRFDSTASCGNANLGCMSAGRLKSLTCNLAVFPVFWFRTVTVKVSKNGGRKSTCSAFTPPFRKAYWKVLTARMPLILEELVLCSILLAALCVLLHKQLVFPGLLLWPRLCCFSIARKWRGGKKKKPATLITIVRNPVGVVVSKKSLKKKPQDSLCCLLSGVPDHCMEVVVWPCPRAGS